MVHARNAQVGLAVQYLVYSKLYAVYGCPAATVFSVNFRVYIDFIDKKRVVYGNGMAGSALRAVGCYDSHCRTFRDFNGCSGANRTAGWV